MLDRRRWRFLVVCFSVVGATIAVTIPAEKVAAVGSTIHVQGTAHGTAVDVSSVPLLPPIGEEGTRVQVATSASQIDSNGIGIGSLKADGSAASVSVAIDGVVTNSVGEAATSAPPESTDSDAVPDVDLGIVQAAVLSASSEADDDPVLSDNEATVAQAAVAPAGVPVVTTTDVRGAATAAKLGDPGAPAGQSDGSAQVALARVELVDVLVVEVEAITAEAHAYASGSLGGPRPSTASASCTFLNLTINGIAFPAPACDGSTLFEIPGVVTVATGSPTTDVQPNRASASIDALTVTLATGQTVVLAHADAATRRITTVPGNPCPPFRGRASAAAAGQVADVDLLQGVTELDVVRAQGKIDTHGIDRSKFVASADGEVAHAASPIGPIDLSLADSHAKAPPNTSDSAAVASTPPGSPVAAKVLASTADASGPADYPTASATADAAEVGDLLTPLALGVDAGSASADAVRLPGPGNVPNVVTAEGSSSAAQASALVGLLPVTVDLIQATATATATGVPGGADATASFSIAKIQVGLQTIQPVPSTPGTVIDVAGLVRLTIGVVSSSESSDGTTASASVDALVVESLVTGDRVVLGHADATATSPLEVALLGVRKGGDVGDDDLPGTVLHAGDVIRYGICLTNLGGVTFTNVQVADQVPAGLEILDVPAGATVAGQLVTTAPITLNPGDSENFSILVKVPDNAQPNARFTNRAVVTADQLLAPLTSNPVTYKVTAG